MSQTPRGRQQPSVQRQRTGKTRSRAGMPQRKLSNVTQSLEWTICPPYQLRRWLRDQRPQPVSQNYETSLEGFPTSLRRRGSDFPAIPVLIERPSIEHGKLWHSIVSGSESALRLQMTQNGFLRYCCLPARHRIRPSELHRHRMSLRRLPATYKAGPYPQLRDDADRVVSRLIPLY